MRVKIAKFSWGDSQISQMYLEQTTLVRLHLALLGLFRTCNNIFIIINQCRFFYFYDRPRYSKSLNFTKCNTPPWVFFMFFKLYKWYQIAQNITYARAISSINIFILCSNVQHVFSKYVTTVQSNWIIFFQESLEICAFFKCVGVHIYKNHQST